MLKIYKMDLFNKEKIIIKNDYEYELFFDIAI
jgi:hypothetical protein